MGNTSPTAPLAIRLASSDDLDIINQLDSFSASPTRDIPREMHKYFGSVDPTTHERILIFLAEIDGTPVGKAELMLPSAEETGTNSAIGYVKRVVVHPDYRGYGVARRLMEHIIAYARSQHNLDAIDLHVWEGNVPAIRLYESLGFQLQHRELYFRLSL